MLFRSEFRSTFFVAESGHLAALPRLMAGAIAGVAPPAFLPQGFSWLALILEALFCAILTLPQFAQAMPSAAARGAAALFIGTYPEFTANLPEHIAAFGLIPLIWLGLAVTETESSVKLLLDAIGSSGIGNDIFRTLESGGCQVAWFHPIHWYTLQRANHRNHRKSIIIDGRLAFSGGAGLAEHWVGSASRAD